jgi:hypothetical protein
MADLDALSLKLDRVLAGQEQHRRETAAHTEAMQAVLMAITDGITPALATHREMLAEILKACTAEPTTDLGATLRAMEAAIRGMEMAVRTLTAELRRAPRGNGAERP